MTSISAVEMLEQYQTENDRLRAQLAAMRKMLEGASKNSKRYLFLRDMSGELDVGTVPTVRPLPSQSDDYWALCGEVLDAAIDAQLNALAVDQVADAGKAMCSDGGQCGIGGYCDNCKTGAAKPSPSDTDRLNLLAGLYEIHGGYDYDDGDYVLHQVTGNINDREYKIIGKGVGLREALDNAKKAGTV